MSIYSGLLKRAVPVSLRVWRSNLIDSFSRDFNYYEKEDRREFFRKAIRGLQFNGITGDFAEFGCCGAMTFRLAFKERSKLAMPMRLWAFDSFEGLPPQSDARDDHPMWVAGDMSISLDDFNALCRSAGLTRKDYETVKGFYNDTLKDTALARTDRPAQIALAYIDCDLYSSTVDVMRFLSPRLKSGMIVAFDDFYCGSGTARSGERRAFQEWEQAHPEISFVPYLPIGWHGMSFIVEMKEG